MSWMLYCSTVPSLAVIVATLNNTSSAVHPVLWGRENRVPQDLHVERLPAASASEYIPSGQRRHVLATVAACVSEYVPRGHTPHCARLVSPAMADHVPAGHGEQTGALSRSPSRRYVPAAHTPALHAPFPPSSWYMPPMHTAHEPRPAVPGAPKRPIEHAAHCVPSCFVPAGHAKQVPEPAVDVSPDAHAVHSVDPAGEKNPAAQAVQDELDDACARLPMRPGEQLLHCESAVAPCALEYFPLAHDLHVSVVCSSASPYLPATQAVHDAWPVAS